MRVTLAIEDGEKVIYPRCRFLDGGRLSIASMNQDSIFDRNRAFITGDMRCEEGYFYLPEGPGLGVEPRETVFDYVMGA